MFSFFLESIFNIKILFLIFLNQIKNLVQLPANIDFIINCKLGTNWKWLTKDRFLLTFKDLSINRKIQINCSNFFHFLIGNHVHFQFNLIITLFITGDKEVQVLFWQLYWSLLRWNVINCYILPSLINDIIIYKLPKLIPC